eukprot:3082986-Pleurochrysis_carterae.AAC.1
MLFSSPPRGGEGRATGVKALPVEVVVWWRWQKNGEGSIVAVMAIVMVMMLMMMVMTMVVPRERSRYIVGTPSGSKATRENRSFVSRRMDARFLSPCGSPVEAKAARIESRASNGPHAEGRRGKERDGERERERE